MWLIVFVSFFTKGHNGFMLLMRLDRFPLTSIALCRHLHMNMIICGGVFFRCLNALNILLGMKFILEEEETLLFIYCLYADLVEKIPEGRRVHIGLSLSLLSPSIR